MRTYQTINGVNVPLYKLLLAREGNNIIFCYSTTKFWFPKLNTFSSQYQEYLNSTDGIAMSIEQISQLSKQPIASLHFCTIDVSSTISLHFALFLEFDNVKLENPYMNIQWPVNKETNRLKLERTGSGWWIYYKNDLEEWEKARKPDGSEWLVYSRAHGMELIYRINGWSLPKGGFY